MTKSFRDRRFQNPDYDITVRVRGVHHGDSGMVDWDVEVEWHTDGPENKQDCEEAAGILERAVEVLRDS